MKLAVNPTRTTSNNTSLLSKSLFTGNRSHGKANQHLVTVP